MGLNTNIENKEIKTLELNPVILHERREVEHIESKDTNLFDILKTMVKPSSWDNTFLTPFERAPHGYAWLEHPFEHRNDWA